MAKKFNTRHAKTSQPSYLIVVDRGVTQKSNSTKAISDCKLLPVVGARSYCQNASVHQGTSIASDRGSAVKCRGKDSAGETVIEWNGHLLQ